MPLWTFPAIFSKNGLEEVSHENQEGSKVISTVRSSFKDVSSGSFLYFQSGSYFKSAKYYSATYNRKKLAFFLTWALNIGFLPPGTSMPCMLKQYMPAQCMAMSCMAMPCKPRHASHIMHGHVMHSHVMHGHVMHTNSVHWMLYVRINSYMPPVTIGQKPV